MNDNMQLGRYRLERQIASGGMAEIWLAKQDGPAGFQKDVVVKRIRPHLASDEKFVEMFLDEARLAAQLDHPNIVQIFDLGHVGSNYFIAMEYVDGWDVEAIIDRSVELRRHLHPAICARIISDACTGLGYAHEFKDRDGNPAGLVHRDISPQNIRVARSGLVKVMDFGIAKAATSSHKTQTGAVKGKLSYMSPEQIMAQDLDARSDVFALGIVLYELLVGQRPFGHESELLAITAIMNQQPRSLSDIAPNIPDELEQIVLRSLAKERDQRFHSAAELQLALEQYLRSEGLLLTQRDISEYLADLFSATPSGRIAALERSNYGGPTTQDNAKTPGSTGAISSGPTRINHAGGLNTITQVGVGDGRKDEQDRVAPRSNKGVFVLIALMLIGVLGAGAALVFFVVLPALQPAPPAGDGSSSSVAAVAQSEGSSLVEIPVGGSDPRSEGSSHAAVLGGDMGADATPSTEEDTDAAGAPDAEGSAAAPAEGSGVVAEATAPADEGSAEASGETEPAEEASGAADEDTNEVEQTAQAERTPTRPRQPANVGNIRVILNESATVYLDGRRQGNYAAGSRTISNVRAGTYTLRAVSNRGVERSQSVDVRSGQTRAVRVQF